MSGSRRCTRGDNSMATPPTKNELSTSGTEILACLDVCK